MECLAAGRGISLPSTSAGGSKLITRVATIYAILRKQFGTSIAKFEGIEEVLARMIKKNYIVEALRSFTAGSVDLGAKPAVVSAIAKYHATEIFRQNINDGMDILGGRAIIRGPRNLLANAYFSTPISITVEGANILTRSLIQFGQGAIMSHPFVYQEIIALENNNLTAFDKVFFSHIGHLFSNIARTIILSITRGKIHKTQFNDKIGKYEQKIAWCCANFAFLTDIALAKFGGNLKRKEKLNGRFGDVISAVYMAVAVLQKYNFDGRKKEHELLVELALKELLINANNALNGIYQNIFDGWLRIIFWPFVKIAQINQFSLQPSDKQTHLVVKELLNPKSSLFNDLTSGIYINQNSSDNLGRLENCLNLYYQSQEAQNKINNAVKNNLLPNKNISNLVSLAVEKNIINQEEEAIILKYLEANFDAMMVDEYSLEDYKKI